VVLVPKMKGSTASTGLPLPSQSTRMADRLRREAPASYLAEACRGDSSMEIASGPSASASRMSRIKFASTTSLNERQYSYKKM
jgi:hypothetical protein